MILVVDVVKGVQTQTAECLLIGEILTDQMVVVLNKVWLTYVQLNSFIYKLYIPHHTSLSFLD